MAEKYSARAAPLSSPQESPPIKPEPFQDRRGLGCGGGGVKLSPPSYMEI